MFFLVPRYDLVVVTASVLTAIFAAYVAFDLARRVRAHDRRVAHVWWLSGSLVLGTGIWAMHFIGMLAFQLPIALGYAKLQTVLSWAAAVGVSAVALRIASRGELTPKRLTAGSLIMGAGICGMHYIGMAALDMAPGIVWNVHRVAASAAIAVLASAFALGFFFWLRRWQDGHPLYQSLAAIVMGLAISGMHYTGMSAAGFVAGAVCLSAGSLASDHRGLLVTGAAAVLLAVTLFTSLVDARGRSRYAQIAVSLQRANDRLQQANERMQKQALLDLLTGLPNRLLFEDRLLHAVGRNERRLERGLAPRREQLAVFFVDLDGFKPVNDSLGHAAGDAVLCEAGRRLRAAAAVGDTVARVGGDGFLVLVEDAVDAADCLARGRCLADALAAPFELAGQPIRLAGSVGVALYPEHGPADKLVANADAAMDAAKRMGGNACVLFESHMAMGALAELSLQNDLRQAIARGELTLHYQPKVDARRGRIRGAEALLRWHHPQRGDVSPAVFIPVAERFGLINAIGGWVVDEACRQLGEWADAGLRLRVAINVSAHQLREGGLVERIGAALERHGVEPSRLLCEITESVAMEDVHATQRTFDGLAAAGVFLSIDDFGTGYSSLASLRQLPARQLKIDRSFVNDIETSADARAIVDAVVRLAHALGLEVVAEGVETAGQVEILRRFECDEFQGYFFAKPMSADALLAWSAGHGPLGGVAFSPSVFAPADELPA